MADIFFGSCGQFHHRAEATSVAKAGKDGQARYSVQSTNEYLNDGNMHNWPFNLINPMS